METEYHNLIQYKIVDPRYQLPFFTTIMKS